MPMSVRATAVGLTTHDGGGDLGKDGNISTSAGGGQLNGFAFVSKKRRAREKNKAMEGIGAGTTMRGVAGYRSDADPNKEAASRFFADRLSRAWQDKLWDLIGNTDHNISSTNRGSIGGGSRGKTAMAASSNKVRARRRRGKRRRTGERGRDGSGPDHEGPLSSAQRASLTSLILHRPKRDVLYNSGVLVRGGLLCVLDCDRPHLTDGVHEGKDSYDSSDTKQTAKTRAIEENVRLSRPIAYLGPGFVPLPKLCVAIACGVNHTLALLQGGAVWVWGKNDFGQLGFPAAKSHAGKQLIHEPRLMRQLQGVECISAACGTGYCVAITAGGGVYTWGNGACGQLGTGNFPESRYNPVRIEHRRMWVSLQSTAVHSQDRASVCCGASHTGIRSVRGDVWIWGNNRHGQVTGIPPAPPKSVGDSDSGEKFGNKEDGGRGGYRGIAVVEQ